MKNEITLQDGNKIIIDIHNGYCTDVIQISKGYFEEKRLKKSITLTIWDDISFHGYISDDIKSNSIEFDFEINDPIYFCLNRLLKDKEILIIEDDETYETNEKYIIIKKEKTTIKIIFVSKTNEKSHYNKYNVFIKNIGQDPRSKIADLNIKYDIVNFFKECKETLLENNHQITFDEYIEESRIRDLTKSKNEFVRKRKK